MKAFTSSLFLLFATWIFGQDDESLDGLRVLKLQYEVLDSIEMIVKYGSVIGPYRQYVTEFEREGFRLIYHTNNANKHTSLLLPDSNLFPASKSKYPSVQSLEYINIDHKGKPEVILRGNDQYSWRDDEINFGMGAIIGLQWLMIINVDSIPTQLLRINYGCYYRCGDMDEDRARGRGAFAHYYEREIKISANDNEIVISPIDTSEYPFGPFEENEPLTKLPPGTYQLEEGKIKLKK